MEDLRLPHLLLSPGYARPVGSCMYCLSLPFLLLLIRVPNRAVHVVYSYFSRILDVRMFAQFLPLVPVQGLWAGAR